MKESFLSIKEIFHIGNGKARVFIFLAFLSITSSFLEIFSIQYTQSLSEIFNKSAVNSLSQIIMICGRFLLLIVLATIVRNYFCFKVSVFSNDIIKNIRDKAYSKLIEMEYELAKVNDNAFYINMIDNNVSRLDLIFSTSFFTLLSDIFDTVWICFFVIQINAFSLFVLIAGIFPLILIGNISASKQKEFAEKAISLDKNLIKKIDETNANFSYIKLFKGQIKEINSFRLISNDIMENDNLSSAELSIFFVIEKSVRYLFIVISLFILSKDMLMNGGDWIVLVPFLLYAQRFYGPFSNLNRYSQLIQKAVSSADKLIDFIALKSNIEFFGVQTVSNSKYEIVLNNISKNFESEKILKNITFSFEKGINLVDGKSGVGKSTLLKIIMGLLRPSNGKVTLYSNSENAQLFSYSGQSNELFNLSVIENVIYPRSENNLSSLERTKLKKLLNELGFKESMLDKHSFAKGENLSGGERKRLSVLRAIYHPSNVLILDEPFANLDANSIEIIAQKIENVSQDKIVIIVSHEMVIPSSLKIDKHLTLNNV